MLFCLRSDHRDLGYLYLTRRKRQKNNRRFNWIARLGEKHNSELRKATWAQFLMASDRGQNRYSDFVALVPLLPLYCIVLYCTDLVCYTAVFSLVTQRFSPHGEVRSVTTLKTWGKVSHRQLNSCELAVGFCAEKKNKNQNGHPGNKYSPGWAKGTALWAFDYVTYMRRATWTSEEEKPVANCIYGGGVALLLWSLRKFKLHWGKFYFFHTYLVTRMQDIPAQSYEHRTNLKTIKWRSAFTL